MYFKLFFVPFVYKQYSKVPPTVIALKPHNSLTMKMIAIKVQEAASHSAMSSGSHGHFEHVRLCCHNAINILGSVDAKFQTFPDAADAFVLDPGQEEGVKVVSTTRAEHLQDRSMFILAIVATRFILTKLGGKVVN